MEIRPIRSEADHDEALREIESLWGSAEGASKGDRLEVLLTLVEAYERAHHPIDAPDPIEAIRFRLEQQGADYRALSLAMIRSLHERLGIPAEVLIRPVVKRQRRKAVKQAGGLSYDRPSRRSYR